MKILIMTIGMIALLFSCTKTEEIAKSTPVVQKQEKPAEAVITLVKTVKPLTPQKGKLPINEMWKKYNELRKEANRLTNAREWEASAEAFVQAAEYATQLERPGIASWQYNSAGKTLINAFKERTEYVKVMQKLVKVKDKDARKIMRKTMKKSFASEFSLLKPALTYLSMAEDADAQHPKDKGNKGKRLSLIKSNLSFVEWVDGFTKDNRKK